MVRLAFPDPERAPKGQLEESDYEETIAEAVEVSVVQTGFEHFAITVDGSEQARSAKVLIELFLPWWRRLGCTDSYLQELCTRTYRLVNMLAGAPAKIELEAVVKPLRKQAV